MANYPIRVLLIDDDKDDFLITRELLSEIEGMRFDLDWVTTYDAALRAIEQQQHDVYLVDYRLGEWNGLELLGKTVQLGCQAPFILLTGLGDRAIDLEAMKAGAADYLVKGQLGAPLLERSIRYALERTQTLETLRQSEERFRRLVQLSPETIAVFKRGNLVYVNPAGVKLLGAASSDELVGSSLLDHVHPTSQAIVQEQIGQIQVGQAADRPIEVKIVRLDGQVIDAEARATPVTYDGHAAVQVVISDISERKRAETKIRRRNRELTLLNRLIAASTTAVDPESILETACRELAQFFDVPHATAALLNVDKQSATVIAESLIDDWPPALYETLTVTDNPSFQYLFTHKAPLVVNDTECDPYLPPTNGLLRQRGLVSLILLPLIIEDEVVGSLGLGSIEPRHFSAEEINLAWSAADQVAGAVARARLAQTQQRLITAIEQTAEMVLVTDTEGRILYVNPAFEQITGYSRAEALGQNPRFLKSGKHDPAFYQDLWSTIEAGQVWRGRIINKKKDGTLYTEDATVTPVRNGNGAIVNYVAAKRDVTSELQLEEQYRQAQKMEAIGQLTGGIAHDFNNMLTAINGFAELLQYRLPADSPFQDLAGRILYSGQRATDLVRQLLAFSRKQVIEPKIQDLNKIVNEMNKMLPRIIGEDIMLKTNLASDLWLVKVDPAQIEQVLVNLAVNARDAMLQGGQLNIETANVVLNAYDIGLPSDLRPGEHVVLTVKDTGVGMTEEVRARIFEPFFTTKEVGKGTGLGLATVFGIVKQSGGDISVFSEEGQGTTFMIYLPRAQESAPPLTNRQTKTDLPSGCETILLVEDDAEVRKLTRLVLQKQGYTLLEAQNSQEALELSTDYPESIHLLLTDVVMPGTNGKTLAKQLSQDLPNLKILFMSGYTDEVIGHHGVLDPDVAFLSKPFNPIMLAHKVRAVLDG